jgi:hypothetical protein
LEHLRQPRDETSALRGEEKSEACMSAAAISFGAEIRIVESSSVRCSDSALCVDTDMAENRIIPKSGKGDDHRVCD